MIRQAYLSILARNASWSGEWACEPCESGWASEAIFFVRVLHADPRARAALARVQLSPDGLHWIDEGSTQAIGTDPGLYSIRVRHFGGWLRLAGRTEGEGEIRVVCYLHLKE
jgi:hypothetical protein